MSTKERILEKIKTRGNWIFRFHPLSKDDAFNLSDCKELPYKHSVTMRGWDFPHLVQGKNDENNFEGVIDHSFASASEFEGHIEFWRFHQSAQFIMLRSLRDDWFNENGLTSEELRKIQPGEVLMYKGSLLYELSEFINFTANIVQHSPVYDEGVKIYIRLNRSNGRKLWNSDPRSLGFYQDYICHSDAPTYVIVLDRDKLVSNRIQCTKEAVIYFLEQFSWLNYSDDAIDNQLKKFYEGRI